MTFPDGRQLQGDWYNDKQHGESIYIKADGTTRKGKWIEGKRTEWLGDEQMYSDPNESKFLFTDNVSLWILERGAKVSGFHYTPSLKLDDGSVYRGKF